jgi:hypothetical protein
MSGRLLSQRLPSAPEGDKGGHGFGVEGSGARHLGRGRRPARAGCKGSLVRSRRDPRDPGCGRGRRETGGPPGRARRRRRRAARLAGPSPARCRLHRLRALALRSGFRRPRPGGERRDWARQARERPCEGDPLRRLRRPLTDAGGRLRFRRLGGGHGHLVDPRATSRCLARRRRRSRDPRRGSLERLPSSQRQLPRRPEDAAHE